MYECMLNYEDHRDVFQTQYTITINFKRLEAQCKLFLNIRIDKQILLPPLNNL